MSNIDFVQLIVDELGAEIGLGEMKLNGDGRLGLTIGPLEVSLVYESEPVNALWLIAPLGQIGDDEEASAFVLKFGFLSWLRSSVTLALDEDEKHVIGFTAISAAALSLDTLRTGLQNFIANGLRVQKHLAECDYGGLDISAPKPPWAAVPDNALRV